MATIRVWKLLYRMGIPIRSERGNQGRISIDMPSVVIRSMPAKNDTLAEARPQTQYKIT